MPANSQKTDIRLMRGSNIATNNWIANSGEPYIDLDTLTLLIGDGVTAGGLPINTATTTDLDNNQDLDTLIIHGRYYFVGIINGPTGIDINTKIFLTVYRVTTNTPEILQTIEIVDGDYAGKTFTRSSINSGTTWSSWITAASNGVSKDILDDSKDLNDYTIGTDVVYMDSIVNGPPGTENCAGILVIYTEPDEAPDVYQTLYLTECDEMQGRIYTRYSSTGSFSGNLTSPSYTWREQNKQKIVKYINSNYTITTDDDMNFLYSTGSSITITLPTGGDFINGFSFIIKNATLTNLTLAGSNCTVNTLSTETIHPQSGATVYFDGTNWVFLDVSGRYVA